MSNYTTGEDLVTDILFRAGEPTDGTSDFDTVALQYLNRAYQGIWAGGSELDPEIDEVWWWLTPTLEGTLTLNPVITTGTVSVTQNSTSITFSSAPASSVAGYVFKVDGHADIFYISAHTGGNAGATLDSVYTGADDTTAAYQLGQSDYAIADILTVESPMRAFQDGEREISFVAAEQMAAKWEQGQFHTGVPQNFTILNQDSDDDFTIRFSHFGSTNSSFPYIRVQYRYRQVPSDLTDAAGSLPLVPRQYRKILSDWALGLLLADKDDTKATDALVLAKSGLLAMSKEHRRRMHRMGGDLNGAIVPRLNRTGKFRTPLRTESGHIIG